LPGKCLHLYQIKEKLTGMAVIYVVVMEEVPEVRCWVIVSVDLGEEGDGMGSNCLFQT